MSAAATPTSPAGGRGSRLGRRVGLVAAVPLGLVVAILAWWLVIDGRGTRGLGHIVGDVCVPMQAWTGRPFPCLEVSTAGGFAVLRAPFDRSQVLVVPLASITGLEDPATLADNAPRLWPVAWRERTRIGAAVSRRLGDGDIALAVNAQSARTQSHYHIHVDCLAAPVKRFLAETVANLDQRWQSVRPAPWSALYQIRRIDLASLASEGAERIVARELAPNAEAIEDLSIAVLGTDAGTPDDPVLVLAVTFGTGDDDGGHTEELMDHRCRE